jgi:glycosyltransferase involved in cell wall biosynthesis
MMADTVLLVHNRYRERGGEEGVYEAEARLLQQFGHRVIRYERDSRTVPAMSTARVALRSVWSVTDYGELRDLVRREGVGLVHFHNTFPLISPAAHYAARAAGVAVVQTLHNFRLFCPGGLFLRDGVPCEKCLVRAVPWPAAVHRCYRDSVAASTAVAGMLTLHRVARTWQTRVDAFVALSRFARDRFIRGGLPAEKVHIGTGIVELPQQFVPGQAQDRGAHFLYVGRLEQEKGIDVLLRAWEMLPADLELQIIGDGERRGLVEEAAGRDPRIRWAGQLSRERVLEAMRGAYALVFPSLCYENFPAVLAEAQAVGLPVVASDLGSGAELVADGGFGLLFHPGDAAALASAVLTLTQDRERHAQLARRARARYDELLTPRHCYERLLGIYEQALAQRRAGRRVGTAVPRLIEPEHPVDP